MNIYLVHKATIGVIFHFPLYIHTYIPYGSKWVKTYDKGNIYTKYGTFQSERKKYKSFSTFFSNLHCKHGVHEIFKHHPIKRFNKIKIK